MARARSKPSRTRRRWTEAERRQILQEFEASGLSMRAFGAKHGVAETNLAKWRQRQAAKRPGAKAKRGSKPAFVEVGELALGAAGGEFDYELRLAGGHAVRLKRGFDRGEVDALVAALAR